MKKIMFNDLYGLQRAVLDGRKTMTRRIANIQPMDDKCHICWLMDSTSQKDEKYNGRAAWIRNGVQVSDFMNHYVAGEKIAIAQRYEDIVCNSSFEDWEIKNLRNSKGWNNKMFIKAHLMPRQIKITNVFLQRLQDISDDDCLKEGIWKFEHKDGNQYHFKSKKYGVMSFSTAKRAYAYLIDKVCGKGTWESNPYVFVYEFELAK